MKFLLAIGLVATLAGTAVSSPVPDPVAEPIPMPSPTDIPTQTSAQALLANLTVAPSTTSSGYSRSLFPHWITQHGSCDTREVALQRDGTNITEASDCTPTAGTWVSPYDGGIFNQSSEVDIDHLIPLENAWISGAAAWTTPQRQAFANDLTRPQLWTISARINESKGDRSPDQWKPPLQSFWCTYAESYTQVKGFYGLSVTAAEKSALGSMLATC